ncbi:MAG: J domain-containing protein [Deinococcota bacterium]
MAQDHYHILGIREDADLQAIRTAYRQLAKVHHPDLNPGDPYADALFQRINAAYSVLSNPEARRDYDLVRQHVHKSQSDTGQKSRYRPSASSTRTTGWSKRSHPDTSQQNVNPSDVSSKFWHADILPLQQLKTSKNNGRNLALICAHYRKCIM